MSELTQKSAEELNARKVVLEGEIQSNEDENKVFQEELEQIYTEQDRRTA